MQFIKVASAIFFNENSVLNGYVRFVVDLNVESDAVAGRHFFKGERVAFEFRSAAEIESTCRGSVFFGAFESVRIDFGKRIHLLVFDRSVKQFDFRAGNREIYFRRRSEQCERCPCYARQE